MTPAEYEAAMERIDKLMDAEADTPEGDELEELSKRVEEYEAEHFPMGEGGAG